MIKRIRDVQPPHKGGRVNVAQARRAFRQMLGDTKPDFEGLDGVYVRRADGGYSFVQKEDAVGPVQRAACRTYASEDQNTSFREGGALRVVEKASERRVAADTGDKAGARKR